MKSDGFESLINLDPQAIKCPFPIYEDFREADSPAVWVDALEAWVVSRHEDICTVARNGKGFSSGAMLGPVTGRMMAEGVQAVAAVDPGLGAKIGRLRGGPDAVKVLLHADPPDHVRQRRQVNHGFTPARMQAAEVMITTIVDELVETLVGETSVEFVAAFGVPLPLRLIAKLLDLPDQDLPDFKRWSDEVTKALGNSGLSVAEMRDNMLGQYELFQYLQGQLDERRRAPGDDLVSVALETVTVEDRPLSDHEIVNILMQFLAAGNETTTKALTAGMNLLLTRPDLVASLRAEPDQIPSFVEEVLRLESPVQGLYRQAKEDTRIGAVEIKAGEAVYLLWASGNRDRDAFPQRDDVRLGKPVTSHLAFGTGPHLCIGAPLARAEMRLAFAALLEKTEFSYAENFGPDDLVYEPSSLFRGIKRLPVRFTAR